MDKNLFSESSYGLEFSEVSIRRQFVKKVFILVTVMLAICTIFSAFPFIIPEFGNWLRGDSYDNGSGAMILNITACVIFLVIALTLTCVPKLRRTVPYNLILLGIFTISAGLMVMCVTAYFTVTSVLMCFAITAGIAGSIVIFAVFINKDLTTMLGFMYLFTMWLFFFGLTAMIAVWALGVYWLYLIYSAIAAVFFMLWLAIDVQLVMGNGRVAIGPEEYVFAAMTIFLDILNIFLYILAIFGKVK